MGVPFIYKKIKSVMLGDGDEVSMKQARERLSGMRIRKEDSNDIFKEMQEIGMIDVYPKIGVIKKRRD